MLNVYAGELASNDNVPTVVVVSTWIVVLLDAPNCATDWAPLGAWRVDQLDRSLQLADVPWPSVHFAGPEGFPGGCGAGHWWPLP